MASRLPYKKAGEQLGYNHLNDLTTAARQVLDMYPNAYGMSHPGGSASFPPHIQRRVIVVAEDYVLGRANNIENVYEIRLRYLIRQNPAEDLNADSSGSSQSSSSSSTSSSSGSGAGALEETGWGTDTDGNTYFLDMRDSEDTTLADGDILSAYYDPQCGMWLPLSGAGGGNVVKVGRSFSSYPPPPAGSPQPWDYGRAGNRVIMAVYDAPGSDILLGISTLISNGGWTIVGATSLPSAVGDSANLPADATYVHSSVANTKFVVGMGNTPASFLNATSAKVVIKWMWDTASGLAINDIRRPLIQVMQSDLVTPLTSQVEAPEILTDATPTIHTINLPIVGTNDQNTWDGAVLSVSTGTRAGGRMVIYSVNVELVYESSPVEATSENLIRTGEQIVVYLRVGSIYTSGWMYAKKFSWGWECLTAECG